MRLEKVILDGFKSFADKTEFLFNAQVTGIVGPNGCGKSNVVDAVKWVLGEQSVKSLRSGQMADVIFGGSSSRKALNSAEVSLFFSNTSGQLALETDEVQITRRIYRSGECDYLINNKVCRLKDIRELFMDTGVGVKAYSIIEQGQVDQLLSSTKADRRAIFEEAAGISKYKAHKKEAMRRLERTEQNLLRLADILGEVQKQLRSVKLAAGKARNYLEYTKKLKELSANYWLSEYHKMRQQYQTAAEELGKMEQAEAEILAEIARSDASVSQIGNDIIEAENEVNKTDNNLVSVESRIEQSLQKIEFLQSRTAELQERVKSAAIKAAKLQEEKKSIADNLSVQSRQEAECRKEIEGHSEAIEQIQEEIQQGTAECSAVEAELNDEKAGIIDVVRRTAQLHNELQSIGVYRDNLANQKERLSGRANVAKIELEKLLAEKASYQARLGDIEKVLGDLTTTLEQKQNEMEKVSEELAADSKRLAQNKEARSALVGEVNILADMEARREGLNNAVKAILESRTAGTGRFDYVEGVVADIISAEVEYAAAAEAALEGQTDTLVASCTEKVLGDKETVDKLEGRVHFLCADKLEPFTDMVDLSGRAGVRGRIIEFVKYDGRHAGIVWKLLGKTVVVEDLQTAIELAEELGSEYRFVTPRGEVLEAGGMVRLGPVGKAAGLISRKSRLRQLEATIANINEQIAAVEEKIERNNQSQAHLGKLYSQLRTSVYEANTEKMQAASAVASLEHNISKLSQEQPLLAGEIKLLEEQIAQSVQKEYDSKQKLQEMEEINNQREERIKQLEGMYETQKQQLTEETGRLTELKVSMGQFQEQSKGLKQAILALQGQLNSNQASLEATAAEIGDSERLCQQAGRDILSTEGTVSELFAEKERAQQASRELHDKIEKLLEKQKEMEQLIRQKRTHAGEIEQKLNQLKIEKGQLEVRQQGLVDRVREELQLDITSAYESYQEQAIDWEKVREEIAELRSKIERLGNVNVEAINEQEDLEKRNDFYSSQLQDLNSSKAQLHQLISRLNKKSREQFAETFEKIRINFQEIFRKLFGGGKADIILEQVEGEDILDAGIEVIAKPPGKETRSISLLSGGEKTMTAIALLFSVFKSKPSPFLFLDEVDAPLDEANNERFNLLVKEFQQGSQFVIITHSKRTMSIADTLFGITMQTRGVSKKISVSFEQFDQHDTETAVA